MNSEIKAFDGKLYVVDPWENAWTQPVKYRSAWPTGLSATDYEHFVGEECSHVEGGLVRLKNGVMIALEHRGETRPAPEYCEERRIPKAPGCHEYRNGRWVK